jgi:hypothetical protein
MEKPETTPSEYGPPNPPPLTPRQMWQRQLQTAVQRALKATNPAEQRRAIDDAAKAILKGLRPNAPYAD